MKCITFWNTEKPSQEGGGEPENTVVTGAREKLAPAFVENEEEKNAKDGLEIVKTMRLKIKEMVYEVTDEDDNPRMAYFKKGEFVTPGEMSWTVGQLMTRIDYNQVIRFW